MIADNKLFDENHPLEIADQGFFFVGGTYGDDRTMAGQMHVQYQIPKTRRFPYPIVMIHGGGQTGVNFLGTPDGRRGWADYFVSQGYAVYVIDQPGRGRSGYNRPRYGKATLRGTDSVERRFTAPENAGQWPQAKLHTQWPGSGAPDDPVTLQMISGYLPEIESFSKQQFLNRDALVALIDRIGPAILMVHSQAGAFGWPVGDARHDQVKAMRDQRA